MKKRDALKSLETVIGKLSHLNFHIEGNQLQDAIRATAYVRDRLQSGELGIRKTKK